MYQALYRKYRPRCFRDVTGQEHITETLRGQMLSGKLSHAYLFVGTRGTGKTTCAKILSRAVNCLSPVDGDACNACASCIGIENGSTLDVLELDAASNNGVDNIRALREEAVYAPASVKKRVYIVDEVHMLSTSAFNALLKILEEPPEHLVFILATTELHKVPATIMSRCQRFMFKRIQPDAIKNRLNDIAAKEGLDLADEAASKLATLADGSMRDAISLFDQCATGTIIDLERVLATIGLAGQKEILNLVGAIANRDIATALGILNDLFQDGRDMVSLLNELASLMRDLLVYKLSKDSPLIGANHDRAELQALSKKLAPERLFFCLELLRNAVFGLSQGGAAKLTAEMCFIRMCEERLSDETEALLSRISKLEEGSVAPQKTAVAQKEPNIASAQKDLLNAESKVKVEPTAVAAPTTTVKSTAMVEPAESVESTATVEPGEIVGASPIPEFPAAQAASDDINDEIINEPPKASDFWTETLRLLQNDPAVHSVISDGDKVWAELQADTIIVRAEDQFTVFQIGSELFTKPLKDAATKVLGREVRIRVEVGDRNNKEDSKAEKLERLSKFGVVQFE